MSLELVVSNGMLSTGVRCWTLAFLRTLGFTATAGVDPKMKAGADAHLALEHHLQGGTPDECIRTFLTSYQPFSEQYVPTAGLMRRLRHENLSKILDVYLSLNGLNDVNYSVVATEKQLKLELYREPGLVVFFTDKSDGIVKMNAESGGGLQSHEWKTGEYIDDKWFNKYDMDGQITGHVWGSRKAGYDVVGVHVAGIQFNPLPDLADPKNLKIKGGYRSCAEHKLPLDQCYLSHVKFASRVFTRSAEDIAQWEKAAIATSMDYYKVLVDGKMRLDGIQFVPQQGLIGGFCNTCEMKPFCQSHRLNKNHLMQRPARDAGVISSGLYENA